MVRLPSLYLERSTGFVLDAHGRAKWNGVYIRYVSTPCTISTDEYVRALSHVLIFSFEWYLFDGLIARIGSPSL